MRKSRGLPVSGGEFVYGWYCRDMDGKSYIFKMYRLGTSCDCCDGCDCKYDSINTNSIHDVIPETVGQFTGLLDKEGVEIYGGDIVEASIYSDENPQKLLVYYHGTGFVIDYEDSESDMVLVSEFAGSLKIIGDTHTTPKLLEKK